MTAIPADALASRVEAILSDAEAMAALSRTNPDIFFEQKDGLVRALQDLRDDVRDGRIDARDRRPIRTTMFFAGRIRTRQGRTIVAEIRKARPIQAR